MVESILAFSPAAFHHGGATERSLWGPSVSQPHNMG